MAYQERDKIGGTYKHYLYVRQTVVHPNGNSPRGLYDYLQGAYTSPAGMRAALRMMRVKNPDKVYVTDDPEIT